MTFERRNKHHIDAFRAVVDLHRKSAWICAPPCCRLKNSVHIFEMDYETRLEHASVHRVQLTRTLLPADRPKSLEFATIFMDTMEEESINLKIFIDETHSQTENSELTYAKQSHSPHGTV